MGTDGTTIAALMSDPRSRDSNKPACQVCELPLPELEPDSALLRVEFSEVCGTDVHLRNGLLSGVPYPIIPGHVSCGLLEKVRGTVRDVEGRTFVEGDRVTFLDVHRTCHACWQCLVAHATTRCPDRKVYGITYGIDDGLTGGWAGHIYLKPGTRVISLDGVPSETYMAGGCSLTTALHAVDRADSASGDTVLVLGSGPVGLSAIALATLRGARRVLCIGAPDARLSTATAMGADGVVNFTEVTESDRATWVMDHTGGRGADVTIECTGVPAAVTQAMRYTRDAGRVVIVGQSTDHGETSFNPHLDLNKKHLEMRGCWGSDYSHFHRSVDILRVPGVAARWSAIKPDRYPLSRVDEALDLVANGKVIKALIIPQP